MIRKLQKSTEKNHRIWLKLRVVSVTKKLIAKLAITCNEQSYPP